MPDLPDYLHACQEAARAGGAVLLDWVGRFAAREKGPSDLVTDADLAAQQVIRNRLLGQFPEHGFIGEEGAAAGFPLAEFTWIVDPLDGTTNYVHGIPHYAVSIALARGNDLLVGTIYSPSNGESFTAHQGGGAWLNGSRLTVSSTTELSQAVIALSFPPRVEPDSLEIADFCQAAIRCHSVRRTGSSALNLSYLAAGRLDAFWARHTNSWDVAAGLLLVREARGIVTGFDGRPFQIDHPHFIAAATRPLHEALQSMLATSTPQQ